MAYGFGSTLGTGTTDRIDTGVAVTLSGTISVLVGTNRNGAGGGSLGSFFDQRVAGTRYLTMQHDEAGVVLSFTRNYSGNVSANWKVTTPSASTDVLVGFSQDGGATTAPVIYLNGTSQTVTTASAAVGTAAGASGVVSLGNRSSDNARVWDGTIWRLAIWNVVLPASAQISLGLGMSPLCFPVGLIEYVELPRSLASWCGAAATLASGTPLAVAHKKLFAPTPYAIVRTPTIVAAGQPTMRRWGGVPGMRPGGVTFGGASW